MQMNNKVAIFSDLHLGVHQNSDFWLGVANKWADWFIAELKQKNITDIIFCGDFWHYRDEISVKTLSFGRDFLDKFKDFHIYMITGNHDAWYKDTSEINSLSILRESPNITIFDKITTLQNGNKSMTFCPWGTKIEDIPSSDIIFGHFELENFKMNSFKVCDHGTDPQALSEKSPLIFSGHFHLRDCKVFENNRAILYVGNPYEMDFGDSSRSKGYYILDINSGKYDFFENKNTPQHIKIFLSKLIEVKDPETAFNLLLPGNIIKLIIDKNISTDHLDLLVARLLASKPSDLRIDYDVNYNKIKIEADDNYDLSGVDIAQAISEFISLLDINNKKEVTKYTTRLYEECKL